MNHKLQYIKEDFSNIIGIKFNENQLFNYINDLKMVEENWKEFLTDNFYLEVLSTVEIVEIFNNGKSEKLDTIFDLEISDLEMKGIGFNKGEFDSVYYIVCHSDLLDEIRKSFNLEKTDLNITIGYNKRNIKNIDRSERTIIEIKTDFEKTIENMLKDNDNNWSFIFDIKNFPEHLKMEDKIDIIEKNKENILIGIDDTNLSIMLIDQGRGDELWVTNIYKNY